MFLQLCRWSWLLFLFAVQMHISWQRLHAAVRLSIYGKLILRLPLHLFRTGFFPGHFHSSLHLCFCQWYHDLKLLRGAHSLRLFHHSFIVHARGYQSSFRESGNIHQIPQFLQHIHHMDSTFRTQSVIKWSGITAGKTQGTNTLHFLPWFSAFQMVSYHPLHSRSHIRKPVNPVSHSCPRPWGLVKCFTSSSSQVSDTTNLAGNLISFPVPSLCHCTSKSDRSVCSSAASSRKYDACKSISPPFLTPISHRVPFPLSLSTGSSWNGVDMRFSPCNFILQLVWRHIAICCDPDPSFHSCLNLPRYGSKHLSALLVWWFPSSLCFLLLW